MAYTSAVKLIEDIKQDIGRIGNKIARGVAQIAYNDLKIAHESIMDDYYSGYDSVDTYFYNYTDPKVREPGYNGTLKQYIGFAHGYRRTKNLYNNSIVPLGVISSGKHSFKAIIQVGSVNMDNYVNSTHHEFPASVVFDFVWNQSIRGLPPGNRGHIELFDINTSPVGVPISGSPANAMNTFVQTWGDIRGAQVADSVASSI